MKVIGAVLLLALASSACAAPFTSSLEASFEQWKQEHGKWYNSVSEEARAFKVFSENSDVVDQLNARKAGGDSATFKLNHFADMTQKEFASKILLSPRPAASLPEERFMKIQANVSDIPDSYDWRDHGAVTPVKDQGSVGTCWAFSATQNIEGQWALAGNDLTKLAPEQIVDCDGEKQPSTMKADCGVFGGWPFLAFQYVIEAGGMQSEEEYPYCVGTGDCYPCPVKGWNSTLCGPPVEYCNATAYPCRQHDKPMVAHIADWKALPSDETKLAAGLVQTGPISIALNAGGLQFYHKGVYNPHFCDPSDLDHAVLLVGYGTGKSLFGKAEPYWLVKNSWGTKWGEDGYFRIARGTGKCGVNTQAATALVNKQE